MLNEDQYMERTPDLVAKVRALREAAEKEMNRFTRVADYDVRRVVGHGPKSAPVSDKTASLSPGEASVWTPTETPTTPQPTVASSPAPAECGGNEEARP